MEGERFHQCNIPAPYLQCVDLQNTYLITTLSWLVSSSGKRAPRASQRSWVRIPYKPDFLFRLYFRNCARRVHTAMNFIVIISFILQFKYMISNIYSFTKGSLGPRESKTRVICILTCSKSLTVWILSGRNAWITLVGSARNLRMLVLGV